MSLRWLTMNETLTTNEAIVAVLRQRLASSGLSMRVWSVEHGFSASFVCRVLLGKQQITERLAALLGFRRRREWEKVGP